MCSTAEGMHLWCFIFVVVGDQLLLCVDGKEAMKMGVGHFNKQASVGYKSLAPREKDRLACVSVSNKTVDKTKEAAKNFF